MRVDSLCSQGMGVKRDPARAQDMPGGSITRLRSVN